METNKDLLITHLFNATPEVVFKAWTDGEILKRWYAPDGCTIEFKHINAQVNGTFHSCIHDPIHGDCWIKGVYTEVIYPEKLTFTMALTNENGDDVGATDAGKPEEWPREIITTVLFTPVGNQTKVTLHQTVDEATAKQTGAYQSWLKMFDRLNRVIDPIKN